MYSLTPSLDTGDALSTLDRLLVADINPDHFHGAIHHLQRRFANYAATCPAPFIAPGLVVTPEIRRQSEMYLPIAEITKIFNRLYCATLNYPPILSSSPFHNALSWADTFVDLPPQMQFSINPSTFLEHLLNERNLLTMFLFASFLPRRFYGGFRRYIGQAVFIRKWLLERKNPAVRCLDAACGTGEDSYGLATLLLERGFDRKEIQIESWTIDPLEVWAAAHCSFPHDRQRETRFREETTGLFEQGYEARICFRCVNLTNPRAVEPFDLILCNGLLGGPLFHEAHLVKNIVANLAGMLAPGGILLAADSFHAGWKQHYPQQMLRIVFEANGLHTFLAGEGIGGLKPGTDSPDLCVNELNFSTIDRPSISCVEHRRGVLASPSSHQGQS
ncbi:MAG: chemotaxis protein CheR [Desulfuromonadaceae bacterium]|nr:chemotaxis protein CheR [Desulfuromonadaceae bacterium]